GEGGGDGESGTREAGLGTRPRLRAPLSWVRRFTSPALRVPNTDESRAAGAHRGDRDRAAVAVQPVATRVDGERPRGAGRNRMGARGAVAALLPARPRQRIKPGAADRG